MSPATEVDLTSETPPRKMKQALLPFGQSANRQNASPKTNAGIDRNNDILKYQFSGFWTYFQKKILSTLNYFDLFSGLSVGEYSAEYQ